MTFDPIELLVHKLAAVNPRPSVHWQVANGESFQFEVPDKHEIRAGRFDDKYQFPYRVSDIDKVTIYEAGPVLRSLALCNNIDLILDSIRELPGLEMCMSEDADRKSLNRVLVITRAPATTD